MKEHNFFPNYCKLADITVVVLKSFVYFFISFILKLLAYNRLVGIKLDQKGVGAIAELKNDSTSPEPGSTLHRPLITAVLWIFQGRRMESKGYL